MIHIDEKKNLNDFKLVHCCRPRDLYSRFGKRIPNLDFDSSDESVPMNMNKLDQIEYIQRYDEFMSEQERHNQTVNDSSANQQSIDDSSGES